MNKTYLIIAAALGALSVILGAFGAHGLKGRMEPDALDIFETAVKYQFYHVFALLAVAIISQFIPGNLLTWSGRCFIAGVILFSGSLYLLSYFKMIGNTQMNWLGAITPIGGLCFIAGWLLLVIAAIKN
ncbi:DUF423 domain-containing protein [Parafilimonas terrae]|uniref:Uncharacterized membrane protein YgdD, TMEM256/DUF423 family n=1 Tax=Parafilimonas terrae TaxID=1465490 RepID=A0A1I5WBG6_9BACT|nr:DUF423 domain-containing protein [Parafilimonas terrae]SFQ17084.1 Uncharacterized membrane protein YgdD, TMEM256/DUF423 family [Parafilimonas terrae]